MEKTDSYTAFMLDHSAGTHTPAMMLAGDIHALLTSEGAAAAAVWDAVGGAILEDPGDAISPKVQHQSKRFQSSAGDTAQSIIVRSEGQIAWKRSIFGVHYSKMQTPNAKFMKLEPGKSAPAHGHSDLEATIVLHGRFTDGHGVYERGDLVIGEPGKRHKPAAYGDEACICFVAESPRKFWRFF